MRRKPLHLTRTQLDTLFEALALLDSHAEDCDVAEERAIKRRTDSVAERLQAYQRPSKEPIMKILVSGAAYEAACSPHASQVPQEEGWPAPTSRKAGKGRLYVYEGDAALAEKMRSHMQIVGEGFLSGGTDPDTRREGRALLAAAARITRLLAERD
jgi:hypothetical protein